MTKFFVLRGTMNAGKTTTCWLVYRYLSAMADEGKLQTLIIGAVGTEYVWDVTFPSPIPPICYEK